MNDELNFNLLDANLSGNIPVVESIESVLEVADVDDINTDDVDLSAPIIETVDNIEELKTEGGKQKVDKKVEKTDELELEEEIKVEPVIESTNESDDSLNKVYAELLKEKGILDYEDEEFEDSEEWIDNKLNSKLQTLAESSLDPVIKEINDKFKAGVPLEDLLVIKSNNARIDEITEDQLEDDISLQENLVREELRLQDKYDEDDIEKKIDRLKAADMLKEEALMAKKSIKKHLEKHEANLVKEAELQAQQEEQMKAQIINNVKATIDTSNEFIKGVPIKKEEKSKLFEGITKRGKDNMTEFERLMRDKDIYFKTAQFVLLMGANVDNITKTVQTKLTQKTKEKLNTYTEQTTNKAPDIAKIRKALDSIKRSNNY